MNIKQAQKQLAALGVANATGESLALAYAGLVAQTHGGAQKLYAEHLAKCADDKEIHQRTKELLSDRAQAWDVLMGFA